jgi:hypothetical protein
MKHSQTDLARVIKDENGNMYGSSKWANILFTVLKPI